MTDVIGQELSASLEEAFEGKRLSTTLTVPLWRAAVEESKEAEETFWLMLATVTSPTTAMGFRYVLSQNKVLAQSHFSASEIKALLTRV